MAPVSARDSPTITAFTAATGRRSVAASQVVDSRFSTPQRKVRLRAGRSRPPCSRIRARVKQFSSCPAAPLALSQAPGASMWLARTTTSSGFEAPTMVAASVRTVRPPTTDSATRVMLAPPSVSYALRINS